MRRIKFAIIVLAVGGLIAVGTVVAQPEQLQPGPVTPQSRSQAGPMMPGGMMSGGMAMCQQMLPDGMTCPHQEMQSLAAKLATSFAAIETEQDPALLETKLAELGTLVRQLHAKSEDICPMMGGAQ